MTEKDLEAPLDDAIEQEQSIRPDDDSEDEDWPAELPLDADEGDAAEQVRAVDLDEDDYR
ncbi:MAG TPA: hypothetical protein VKD26_11890 [Streptosporangiaceae bacterium]|nr:hypothetical protein [Streptosporangiaceae bacterium]